MKTLYNLHLCGATGQTRTEMLDGKEYLVVPVVALMEGVIHPVNAKTPEFVPFATLEKAAASWNDKPLMMGHPTKNGTQCSASGPELMASHGLGIIKNSHVDVKTKKLLQEAWVEKARAKKLSPQMLTDLEAGKSIEVSVGAFVATDNVAGDFNGKPYKASWLETVGDHLAFLFGGRGACSIEMGCGTHRAAMHLITAEDIHPATEAELEVLGGPGSGWTAEGGHVPGALAKAHDVASQHHASARDMADLAARPDHFGQSVDKHAENQKQAVESAKLALQQTEKAVGKGDSGSRPGPYLTHAKEALTHAKAGRFKEAAASSAKAMIAHEQAQSTLKRFEKMRNASCITFTTLSGDSLDERISEVSRAVEKKYSSGNAASVVPNGNYAYPRAVFDTYVIISKDGELFSVDYTTDAEGEVTLGDTMTKVEQKYVAAKMATCETCDGLGQIKAGDHQKDCPTCDGVGSLKTAAGARHSATDMQMVQQVHDHAVSLGADCDPKNYKMLEVKLDGTTLEGITPTVVDDGTFVLNLDSKALSAAITPTTAAAITPQLKAACRCEGDSTMTKEQKAELIAALTTDKYSGFVEGDVAFLESAPDARLEQFKAAAATNKTAAELAIKNENDLRASQAKITVIEGKLKVAEQAPTEDEWLAKAPAGVKTLLESQKAQEAEMREALIKDLKAAAANTEEELKEMPTAQLQTLARYAKLPTPDFSGRGMPVRRAAGANEEDYTPPNSYEPALKALREGSKAVN